MLSPRVDGCKHSKRIVACAERDSFEVLDAERLFGVYGLIRELVDGDFFFFSEAFFGVSFG